MNDKEREKLHYIIELIRNSNELFDIILGPEECSLLIKYIDYLRDIRGE